MTLLVVDQLRARRAGTGATLEVAAGEIAVLAGPAGSGKSSLLQMIGGQRRPVSGHIRFDGDDVTRSSPRELFRLGVGQTFDVPATFPSMSVRENAQVALLSARGETASCWRGVRRWHRAQADHLLDRLGLLPEADRPAAAIGFASRRRLDLALAVAGRPRLLLLDDPASGLEEPDRTALFATLYRLARDEAVALLLATAEAEALEPMADRVFHLADGTIAARHEPVGSRARRGVA